MSKTIKKKFDFTKFKQRHIALKLLYFGWDYDGLAEQTNNDNTIEYHLFQALTKACLIESRTECKFNRCGRTDKGVSSYGQVVNLNVRSNLFDENDPQNIGLFTPDNYRASSTSCQEQECKNVKSIEEINYVDILNRLLPEHIKVIAWAPAIRTFSSRFGCQSRSYSYLFPKGDLCIESIEKALRYLVGQHDFRNLCSFDIKNGVVNHTRTILATSVRPLSIPHYNHQDNSSSSRVEVSKLTGNQYDFYEIVIVGQAFLYHQIRCIMTILFLVGRKQEQPELVRDLLNIDKCPSRPKYCRASPLPLSLFDCQYKPEDLPLGWIYNQKTLFNIYKQLKKLWLRYKIKSVMIERVLLDVESSFRPGQGGNQALSFESWKDFGLEHDNMSDNKYIPMLRRPCEDPLEAKIELMNNKKKKLKSSDEMVDDDGDAEL